MKKLVFVFIFHAAIFSLFAGNEFTSKGAAENALGNHTVSTINVFSIYNNQAAAAFLDRGGVGIAYNTSYLPVNVNDILVAGAAPLSFGTIGGNFRYFGNNLYSEMKLGLAYAMKLGKYASIGVQLDYLNSRAQNYGTKHFVTFELGVLYQPIEKIRIGAHIYNPVKWKVDETTDEILPIVFNLGLTYTPFKELQILAELEKDIEHPFNFKGGIQYEVAKAFFVRGGFNTNPTLFTFGLGYKVKDQLSIDLASNYHLELGFNVAFSLAFEFKKKDEKAK